MALPWLNAKKTASTIISKRGQHSTEVKSERAEPGAESAHPKAQQLAETIIRATQSGSAHELAKALEPHLDLSDEGAGE